MKKISIYLLAFILATGTFFVSVKTQKAEAASAGDVVINEFFTNDSTCPLGGQWFELLNTTASAIDLTGWTLNVTVTPSPMSLTGYTIPAYGMITLDYSCDWAATVGDVVVLKDDASADIHAVSYGNQPNPPAPNHVTAPAADESASLTLPLGVPTWVIDTTPNRGWFNDAINYTCPLGVLTDPGGGFAPTLSSVDTCLAADPTFVETNMGEATDPTNAANIYYEKSILGSPVGRITFAGPLNFTDQNTVTYLKSIGEKMEAAIPAAGNVKVGLDTTDTSSFVGIPGSIIMYGYTGAAAPELLVRDNADAILNCSLDSPPAECPTISNAVFNDGADTYSFDTTHFTSFESDAVAPTIPVANIIGTTIQGAADTIDITFSEAVVAADGTWSSNEFTAVESPNGTSLDLTGASFSYNSGTDKLTITLASTINLANGDIVTVTPVLNKIKDPAGNSLAITEIVGTTAITGDVAAPTVSTYSPTDGNTSAAIDANLVLTFNENVQVGTGNVVIYKASDDSVVETIDITGVLATFNGTTGVTINPTADFTNSTAYYVQIDATAVEDLVSNAYAGIADTTTWNFTTVAIAGGGGGGSYSISDTAPPTNTSISINAGADNTTSTAVTLTLGATGAVLMMISNNADFADSPWETFVTSKNWALSSGNGTKTVYAKFKDAAGNISDAISDGILLISQATDQLVIAPNPMQGEFRAQVMAQLSNEERARRGDLMKGTYGYQLIHQSPYPATLAPGAETEVWIEVKNTGTATWFDNGDNTVRLGAGSSYGHQNQQRDYASEFANPNWFSANRPVNIIHPEVMPGWHTRFQFTIKAPSTPGTYKAYFTPVVDGVQWMQDIGLYWQITVQ